MSEWQLGWLLKSICLMFSPWLPLTSLHLCLHQFPVLEGYVCEPFCPYGISFIIFVNALVYRLSATGLLSSVSVICKVFLLLMPTIQCSGTFNSSAVCEESCNFSSWVKGSAEISLQLHLFLTCAFVTDPHFWRHFLCAFVWVNADPRPPNRFQSPVLHHNEMLNFSAPTVDHRMFTSSDIWNRVMATITCGHLHPKSALLSRIQGLAFDSWLDYRPWLIRRFSVPRAFWLKWRQCWISPWPPANPRTDWRNIPLLI